MSVAYVSVQWNAHKRIYDLIVVALAVGLVVSYVAIGMLFPGAERSPSPEVLLLQGLGISAFALLHVILAIGPLSRLSPRFSPLLYNRRHLGVVTFLIGLAHALLSTLYYGSFGDRNPLLVVLTYYPLTESLAGFPFERLGFFALLVLFVLAATSHDFWLKNLSPRVWKALHMGVYGAYALLVLHVLLGSAQTHHVVAAPVLLGIGAIALTGLHLVAANKSRQESRVSEGDWVHACNVEDLADCRARTILTAKGESVAVFRYGQKISAVSNTCVHQGGPLGEGKIVNGCITCPWHGYQYLPDCGQSPPPFTEKIPTYEVRIAGNRVEICSTPLPPGTPVPPAIIENHT